MSPGAAEVLLEADHHGSYGPPTVWLILMALRFFLVPSHVSACLFPVGVKPKWVLHVEY